MTLPDSPSIPQLEARPSGLLLKIGSRLLRGVAKVQRQIVPYSQQWNEHNQRALQQSGPTWFVLGDSMSQGIGASAYDKGWVNQLETQLDAANQHYRVINLSMSGARIEHVTTMQIPVMQQIDIHPDLITLIIGSNDIVSPRYRKQAIKNYRQLLDALPDTIIVVSPLGDFGRAAAITDLLHEYSAKGKIKVTNNNIRNWRGMLAEDHFHPNDRGYSEIARIFAEVLLRSTERRA